MNKYLLIFLAILLSYSAIWTGIKYWYYSLDRNSEDTVWYVRPYEESATVSAGSSSDDSVHVHVSRSAISAFHWYIVNIEA